MPIPTPEAGLVISYSYLWRHEAGSGRIEGNKDRRCVIPLAIERQPSGETVVTVLPITHRPPDDPAAAVEIPTPSNSTSVWMMTVPGLSSPRVTSSSGPATTCASGAAAPDTTTAFCRLAFSPLYSRRSSYGTGRTRLC
jgi:hypothetical protein